jgi:predicted AlkP superfamily pyrophosphatase or phosphodiesterase
MKAERVVVLDVVGLTMDHLADKERTPHLNRLARAGALLPMRPVFPAVTCPVQTSLLTGRLPREHGILANGRYRRDVYEAVMWDQRAAPVQTERVWDRLRRARPGARTALLFWQHAKYATADYILTPAPIHLEDQLIDHCYGKPAGLYEAACEALGRPFRLPSFWGPAASFESSRWIADAALWLLKQEQPELTLAYLPLLDYNAQRFGPDSDQALADVARIDTLVGEFAAQLDAKTALLVVSEYALVPVSQPVFLNRALRAAGLLNVQHVQGHEYLDLENSRAFALVDHQVAHIHLQEADPLAVAAVLRGIPGVAEVLDAPAQAGHGIDHPRGGDLVAIADSDAWFAYYWWRDDSLAPPFARTVDIHRKPGYDPVEQFWRDGGIPLDASLVRGSHGRPPTGNSGLVACVAAGPGADSLRERAELAATDLPALILDLLGCTE